MIEPSADDSANHVIVRKTEESGLSVEEEQEVGAPRLSSAHWGWKTGYQSLSVVEQEK